jgi:hypothetical protein
MTKNVLRAPFHTHFGKFVAPQLAMFALTLVGSLLFTSCGTPSPVVDHPASNAYIRVNQVGYITNEAKQAILLTKGSASTATFNIINTQTNQSIYSANIGSSQGKWNSTFLNSYLIDFSSVQTVGSYTIQVNGPTSATSPTFKIASGVNLYKGLLTNALFFYQAQRDGPHVIASVMNRQPSHLKDEQASIYSTPTYKNEVLQGSLNNVGGPIDVSGGWFDAGDYLKFVETASYTDAIMLFAVRQYPNLLKGGSADFNTEGKYDLDWLQKMWDNSSKTLYYQVGLGDGNGKSILSDHNLWRLPQADDKLNAKSGDANYFIEYRPVFRAGSSGSQISPNLAGRLAADFGLCYQLYHISNPDYANQCLISGETIFDLAKTSTVGQLLTTAPHDYYPETEWRDDLELGATELYFATTQGNLPAGLQHADPLFYLQAAAQWANAYISGPNADADSLNLYDVSGLAHYELYRALAQAGNPSVAVSQSDLLKDLRNQLDKGTKQAKSDPFGLSIAYGSGDTVPHALGYALEASFYDELTHTSTYETFGLTQRNWILGANAWGSSFIVGAGSTFPQCIHHQIANLSSSPDGKPSLLLGATVNGPNANSTFSGLEIPDKAHECPPSGSDPFKAFSGKGASYLDSVSAWASVEPANDYTALTLLIFAQQI